MRRSFASWPSTIAGRALDYRLRRGGLGLLRPRGEARLGVVTTLDPLRADDLEVGGQERDPSDLAEVGVDRVGVGRADRAAHGSDTERPDRSRLGIAVGRALRVVGDFGVRRLLERFGWIRHYASCCASTSHANNRCAASTAGDAAPGAV